MKTCRICGKSQPVDAFHRAADMRDGYRNECRGCYRGIARARYARDPAKSVAAVDSIGRPFLDAGVTITVECDFGPGTNTALGQLLDRIASRPSATVEILAGPSV